MVKTNEKRSRGRPPRQDTENRREVILDSAIKLYAEKGFENVLIKDVATASGVAPSLVSHHFGSREGLRESCRSFVLAQIRDTLKRLEQSLSNEVSAEHIEAFATALRDGLGKRPYLIRFLAITFMDGHPESQALFHDYFSVFHNATKRFSEAGILRDDIDPRWITIQTIYNQLGTAFLHDQLEALFEEDPYDLEVSKERVDAFTEIAKFGIFKR